MFNTLTWPHSYWWIIRIEGWEDSGQLIALMKISVSDEIKKLQFGEKLWEEYPRDICIRQSSRVP